MEDNKNIMDVVESTKVDDKQIAESVVNYSSMAQPNNTQKINIPRRTRTIIREFDKKVGRNDPCPCGSGKKYKKCCLSSGEYETHIELTKEQAYKVAINKAKYSDFKNSI